MPSLSEQLGFGATDRVAIVHVDDLGMCHAANAGGFEALANGPATCGSVMVPCPWFREAAERANDAPDLDLGVHLTLNAEWSRYRWGPVVGRSAVPSLVDAQGCLPRTIGEVIAEASPEDVKRELRAQIETALEAGIDVTHLDSHMGTVLFPQFVSVYQELGAEFRLPLMIARPDEATLEAAGMAGAKPFFDQLADEAEAAGFPILDGLDTGSLNFAEGEGEAHNLGRLDRLPRGVSYLICHPAREGTELGRITPDSAHHRNFERGFFGGEPGRKALLERGIRTVGMRPLRDLMRAG